MTNGGSHGKPGGNRPKKGAATRGKDAKSKAKAKARKA